MRKKLKSALPLLVSCCSLWAQAALSSNNHNDKEEELVKSVKSKQEELVKSVKSVEERLKDLREENEELMQRTINLKKTVSARVQFVTPFPGSGIWEGHDVFRDKFIKAPLTEHLYNSDHLKDESNTYPGIFSKRPKNQKEDYGTNIVGAMILENPDIKILPLSLDVLADTIQPYVDGYHTGIGGPFFGMKCKIEEPADESVKKEKTQIDYNALHEKAFKKSPLGLWTYKGLRMEPETFMAQLAMNPRTNKEAKKDYYSDFEFGEDPHIILPKTPDLFNPQGILYPIVFFPIVYEDGGPNDNKTHPLFNSKSDKYQPHLVTALRENVLKKGKILVVSQEARGEDGSHSVDEKSKNYLFKKENYKELTKGLDESTKKQLIIVENPSANEAEETLEDLKDGPFLESDDHVITLPFAKGDAPTGLGKGTDSVVKRSNTPATRAAELCSLFVKSMIENPAVPLTKIVETFHSSLKKGSSYKKGGYSKVFQPKAFSAQLSKVSNKGRVYFVDTKKRSYSTFTKIANKTANLIKRFV